MSLQTLEAPTRAMNRTAVPSLAPGEQILLNCARQEMQAELIAATQECCRREVDWERLARTAWRHGVAPLLHRHLSSRALQLHLPDEAKELLRRCYVRAAFRAQTHVAAITEIVGQFERAGVPVILLKGAALCLTTYREPALRPFADIDLLIPEQNIDAAGEALRHCGYTLAPELTSEKLSRRFHVNLPFVRRGDRPVHVELHWQLVDRFSVFDLPTDGCWARAGRLPVGATTARILEVHDAIIYLAAHLDKHGYLNQVFAGSAHAPPRVIDELSANRLIWFTDLHELISSNTIDWALLENRCGRGPLRNVVRATLRLLRDLLGTTGIDPAFLQPVEPHVSKRLLSRLVLSAGRSERGRRFFEHASSRRERVSSCGWFAWAISGNTCPAIPPIPGPKGSGNAPLSRSRSSGRRRAT